MSEDTQQTVAQDTAPAADGEAEQATVGQVPRPGPAQDGGPDWQRGKDGRLFRVHRHEGERPRVEYAPGAGDRPPKQRRRRTAPAGSRKRATEEPTTAMIADGLSTLLSMPSMPFAMQVAIAEGAGQQPDPGAEFMAQHFTSRGPALAQQLAQYSERNPGLRRLLVLALQGESIAGLALAVVGYAAPPAIYLLTPNEHPARRAFQVPDRPQARVIVTPPPGANGMDESEWEAYAATERLAGRDPGPFPTAADPSEHLPSTEV